LTPRRLAPLVFAAILTSLGCHAQSASSVVPGDQLSPALTHRVEVLLRQKAELPPESTISVSPVQPSDVPGYSAIAVTFSSEGKTSHPVNFLISADGKTIAQFIKYDISADPRNLISPDGRPSRGGPPSAPVLFVNFDDLECPFCARFHASLFPAITERYGDKVRIVYKDFPLTEIHPWAMRAAVDVNCLAAQSPTGYWNLVDYIHAHSSEIGTQSIATDPTPAKTGDATKPDKTVDRANTQLDQLTREQGKFQKVDAAKLDACITKQDTSAIEASRQVGAALDLNATPSFFINGAKFDGAIPIEFIFAQIDDALRAENITPPPPYVAPAAPATEPSAKPAPAAKPAPTK
jgi:protein-disulfide isomerase